MSRTTRLLFLGAAVVAAVGVGLATSSAEAQGNLNARLRGAYAATVARTCTISNMAFVGPNLAIPPGASVSRQAASDSSVVTFNGDGTGTTTGRTSSMNLTATGGGILSISEFSSTFDYLVNPDGTVETSNILTTFETVFPPGGSTGTTSGRVGRLQIADGNSMLVSAPAEQITMETQTITPPTGNPFAQYRLCVRSAVYTKLPNPASR